HSMRASETRYNSLCLPLADIVIWHPPRHAEETHGIERHEGDVEADQPEPEGSLAPAFMQAEAERFREPVGVTGKGAEQHAADDDIVEVSDQKQAVVQQEVNRRHGDEH